MITKEQLAELERLARAATPGPWHTDRMPYTERILSGNDFYVARTFGMRQRDLNAAYIAAANPATVLALMADNEAKAVRIAELEQDLVGAFVRIGELEYEVEAAGEAPPILGAADLAAGNRYWARHGPNMKWALIDVSDVEGIEYGMKSWEFFGPVTPPAV